MAAFVVATLLSVATARAGNAHPLHTTLAEVTVDATRHTVRATIRLFADDLSAALSKRSRVSGGELEARAGVYVAAAFSLTASGRPIVLRSCGVRRSADLIWVCLESDVLGDVAHLRARYPLLTESFADQVNIVQIGDGPGRRSVLFLKGDGDKPLAE